ncbi:hypothetical protein QFZ36_002252 [Pseudarthrobacter siccitolerans]|uniref:Uncharacterized protein n=1 Tax=Pseudarthrobacter siccitolerans TaxID=861266 RepID=A0ABU0PN51_9MICC|nr:hypothetical protein [Pseudarthrobacter siccitolerans]
MSNPASIALHHTESERNGFSRCVLPPRATVLVHPAVDREGKDVLVQLTKRLAVGRIDAITEDEMGGETEQPAFGARPILCGEPTRGACRATGVLKKYLFTQTIASTRRVRQCAQLAFV